MRSPRRACRLACGAVFAALVAVPLAAAGVDPYREVSLTLAQELIALFPAAEGKVVSAGGGDLYVDLAATDLLRPGMELQVYRPGGQMSHPLTGQSLGAFEEHLGFVRLIDVRDTYSRGSLFPGAAAAIVPGDRVRLSARRLRSLLHVGGAAAGIRAGQFAQSLLARGEESERFAMVDERAWAPALKALRAPWESVRADPALLRRLGESTQADLLWMARVETDPVPRVEIEVRSLQTGSVLAQLSERWPETPPPAPPASGEYTARDLIAPARALAAGDIIGEGRLEVLLSDGARLALYRWEPKSLAWRWDEEGRPGRSIISLDAADVDGDGRAEVLVTAAAGGRVFSELRRWRDGDLRAEASVEGIYLRAAPRPGAPALLLGQRSGIDEVLSGQVVQYLPRAESLEPVEGSALPMGIGIFGLALAPAGSPVALYALDRLGRIRGLTREGAVVWSSAERYGGYPALLTGRQLFGPGPAGERGFEGQAQAFLGRLLAEKVPGGIRLTIPRNSGVAPGQPAPLGVPARGEVMLLEGPPGSLGERCRSRVFDGYVADLSAGDADADGRPEVLFIVNRFAGSLLGERANIVAWRPGGASCSTRPGENKP